jgi:tetratricopeptide (TPR) repeat protein
VATARELFGLAWQHHQTGRFPQAENLYRQGLQANPSHPDAWCFLGAVCQAQEKLADAELSYRRAIQLAPTYGSAHNCLGALLARQNRLAEAGASFREALRYEPDNAEAHYNLGLALNTQGQNQDAISQFRQALHFKPDYPEALNDLGNALVTMGNLNEARRSYQQALALRPQYAEAHYNLGTVLGKLKLPGEDVAHYREALRLNPNYAEAHVNLGNALREHGQLDDALAHYDLALGILPKYAEARSNRGVVLAEMGSMEEAIAEWHKVLRFEPDHPGTHHNLGNALLTQGKWDEALKHCQEAVRLCPDFAEAHSNLATVLLQQAKWEQALTHYDEAVRLRPNFAIARMNRGMIQVSLGDFEHGWHELEWRWQQPGITRRDFTQPLWDGSDLKGKTLLLFAEQGFGDTFQFMRYPPLVHDRGGRVIVECQPSLVRVLANVQGVDRVVATGSALPPFDVQAPLFSLPAIVHTTLDSVPAAVPYLQPEAELVEKWRRVLADGNGASAFKVGIAWQGSPTYRYDRQRSISLRHFAPLAKIESVQLISLQKGPGTTQLAAFLAEHNVPESGNDKAPVLDLASQLDESTGAFVDTAAVMKNLDLVVCSDSAVAHLAGALAVPIWMPLPLVPDWRWLLNREDCPWYPTMRLFRQAKQDHWDDVFERIAVEMRKSVGARRMA